MLTNISLWSIIMLLLVVVTEYGGPPDPLHGMAPYAMVRKEAKVGGPGGLSSYFVRTATSTCSLVTVFTVQDE